MRAREKLKIVTRLLEDCAGYRDGDELADQRTQALDYYFMRPRGDEQPGRSAVISGDLSAMVEAVLSQMMEAFSGDVLVEFEADGSEDEDQAALESDVCAELVMDSNNGYVVFHEAIKDALLLANGFTNTSIEEEEPRPRVFRDVTPDAYAELTADRPGIKLERINYSKGTLTYSERPTRKKLCVDSVAPENFVYTKNWHSLDLQKIPCCGERRVDMRSDLIDVWRFPPEKVDRLSPTVETLSSSSARNPRSLPNIPNRTGDKSLDLIEWYYVYAMLDTDGDGIAERRRIACVPNKELLSDEPAAFVSYAAGAALINPHRLLGVSLFHKLKQTQDTMTALKRSGHDNHNAANKSRTIYLEGKVAVEDLEDGRVNGNIAVTGAGIMDVRQAVGAHVVPDISAGVLAMIQEEKRTRSELGGASLELASGEAQLTDSVGSQGLDRAYSAKEQLAQLMTRTIAETLVRHTYLIVHRTLRENFNEPVTIRRRGKPVTTNPHDWPERRRLTIKPGMSAGERRRKVEALDVYLNAQLTLAKAGENEVLVNSSTFYKLLMDRGRAAEVPNPEQYFLDPSSEESKAAREKRSQTAQAERQAQQTLMNMALGLEQMRVALDKRNADADRVVEIYKANLEAESKQAGVVGDAATKFELAERTAQEAAKSREHDEHMLKAIDKTTASVKELRTNGAAN